MKKNEITVGGKYVAKVAGKLTVVRVDSFRECDNRTGFSNGKYTVWYVTNLRTGRKTTFRSAAKFRSKAETVGIKDLPTPTNTATMTIVDEFANLEEEPCECNPVSTDVRCEECGGAGKPEWTMTGTPELVDAFAKREGLEKVVVQDETVYSKPSSPLSRLLRASIDHLEKSKQGPPHIIAMARAGCGKTTTGEEGLKLMRGMDSRLTPSPQQQAIWDSMKESSDAPAICFTAFGKDIAEEVQHRLSRSGLDRKGCVGMTTHSMGFAAVRKAIRLRPGRDGVCKFVVEDYIAEVLKENVFDLRRNKGELINGINTLVGLVKQTLSGTDYESLGALARYYDVDLGKFRTQVFDTVPKVIEMCLKPDLRGQVDFNDMVWLPLALDLPLMRYDFMIVDEAQDLNRARQDLVKRAANRLMLVGDDRQAIFGFAGADAESMARMQEFLSTEPRGAKMLPLTVTRRCGKAIVEEARLIVPDFEAHESNPDGKISQARYPTYKDSNGVRRTRPDSETYLPLVQDGDMILCRCNAPLVSQCFKLLGMGRKANILGRDVGAGLANLVKKLGTGTLLELLSMIDQWKELEIGKEQACKNPSEMRIIATGDKADCIRCFTEGAQTVQDVLKKIDAVFTDSTNGTGIKLSSIHKSKGLEARRVYLIEPEGATVPHPMARSKWQIAQEWNLRYVAVTRAIEELCFVS